MDLLAVMAKGMALKEDAQMPSDIWHNKNRADNRSAKQIINDLLHGLGGE